MKYIIKTMSGEKIEITEGQRESLILVLLSTKQNRPAFVEIGQRGAVIAVSTISSIIEKGEW